MPFSPAIFVNLPVASLSKSEVFYAALGFRRNERFCSGDTVGMGLSGSIYVMLMEHPRFSTFTPASKSIASAHATTETLLCISVEKREDVDRIVEVAGGMGGRMDPTVLPEMPGGYVRSVEDGDGHVWEVGWLGGMMEGGGEGGGCA